MPGTVWRRSGRWQMALFLTTIRGSSLRQALKILLLSWMANEGGSWHNKNRHFWQTITMSSLVETPRSPILSQVFGQGKERIRGIFSNTNCKDSEAKNLSKFFELPYEDSKGVQLIPSKSSGMSSSFGLNSLCNELWLQNMPTCSWSFQPRMTFIQESIFVKIDSLPEYRKHICNIVSTETMDLRILDVPCWKSSSRVSIVESRLSIILLPSWCRELVLLLFLGGSEWSRERAYSKQRITFGCISKQPIKGSRTWTRVLFSSHSLIASNKKSQRTIFKDQRQKSIGHLESVTLWFC